MSSAHLHISLPLPLPLSLSLPPSLSPSLSLSLSLPPSPSPSLSPLSLCRNSKLCEKGIHVLRDLLAGHDSDSRYNSPEARARIASIYLPLLSVVMDNYDHLYKGADGWEDWTMTFERNTSIRRSVIIRESADGSLEGDQVR